jgi:uncharacterized protein (DUF362 family)
MVIDLISKIFGRSRILVPCQGTALVVQASYQNAKRNLRDALGEIGIGKMGGQGDRVLVNPNLCGPGDTQKYKEKNNSTHTSMEVLKAAVSLYLDCGIRPKDITIVGNPDPCGRTDFSYEDYYRSTGVLELTCQTGVRFESLANYGLGRDDLFAETQIESGSILKAARFAKVVSEHNLFLNLPIAKTHWRTRISAAYKNIMGIIDQRTRQRMHELGRSDRDLAQCILDLYQGLPVPPQNILHVVDAIVAQEGEGPRNGRDVRLGALIVGRDPLAVDLTAAAVMGFEAKEVDFLDLALQQKQRASGHEVIGQQLKAVCRRKFLVPIQKKVRGECCAMKISSEALKK